MANTGANCFSEGQYTTRPPYFDGNNFSYWKTKMKIYLLSVDYNLWEIVSKGPIIPTKKVENEVVPKSENDFNEDDKKKMSFNAKAINCLYCALCPSEFNRVSA